MAVKPAQSWGTSLLVIAGNGIASLIPLAAIACAAVQYGAQGAGIYSLVLTVAGYCAQLLNAEVVEVRLSGGGGRVSFPSIGRWMAAGGAVLWSVGLVQPAIGWIGMILLIPQLEVSRNVGLVHTSRTRETTAITVLGAAVIFTFALPSSVALWVLLPMAALGAVLARTAGGKHGKMPPPLPGARWVVGETAIVGVTFPAIAALLLGLLGGNAAAGFRVTMSIANLFSPVLSFLRVRLLARSSRSDVRLAAILVCICFATIIGAQTSGAIEFVLGVVWTTTSLGALVAACLWKLLSFLSTVPFAMMRRQGYARQVFHLRLASTCVFLILTAGSALIYESLTAVILGFVISEAITLAIYTVASRSMRPARPGRGNE